MALSKEKKITPALAEAYLKKNTDNRPLQMRHVDFLVTEILAGRWRSTGDPIKFSKSGKLIDGQHRLSAILKSKKTVLCFVIEGLEDDVFKVLDTNKPRTGKDLLALNGVKNELSTAAVIRNLLSIQEKGFVKSITKDRGFGAGIKAYSNEVILDFWQNNKYIEKEISFISVGYTRFNHTTLTVIATLYHIMVKKDKKLADEFFSKYFEGYSLDKTNPIFILRSKVSQDIKGKLTNRDKIILFIMAWNLCRQKRTCIDLKVPKDLAIPEII